MTSLTGLRARTAFPAPSVATRYRPGRTRGYSQGDVRRILLQYSWHERAARHPYTYRHDERHERTSDGRAIYALSYTGKPTFPLLTQALSDVHQPARQHIILAIGICMPSSVGTNACVRPLVTALTDSDLGVRQAATNALRFLAPEAITNGTPPAIHESAEATNAPTK